MAEGLARYLCRTVSGWTFASAGMFARQGAPASPQAVQVMAERGIDLSGHRSRQVTGDLAGKVDYLIALTGGHADLLREQYPGAAGKIHTLYSFNSSNPERDVPDPFGGSIESYRTTRDEIESALSDLILAVITPSMKTRQEKI